MTPIIDPRFPARLRELRKARVLSFRVLGDLTKYSHTYLWEIEHGRKDPTREVAECLDQTLDARGTLTELISEGASPLSPDDEERLTALAAAPSRIDRPSLDALDVLLTHERHREDLVGAAPVIPAVNRHLATLTDAIVASPSPLMRDACRVAGQWAQFAGWLYTAIGQYGRAGLRLDRALEWATLAGDPDLTATVMSFKAHIAWLRGKVGLTAGLNDMVLRTQGVYVGQVAYSAFQRARISAITGSVPDTQRDLSDALALAAEAAENHGEMPPWHYYRTPGFFRLQHGVVLAILSRTEPQFGELALERLHAGAESLPADHRRAEWFGDFLIHEVQVCSRLGDERGRATALDELHSIVDATGSTALVERIVRVSNSSG